MCWATFLKPKQQSNIDIVVYKVLSSNMDSPCYGYPYKYNQINPLEELQINYDELSNTWIIERGYHSFESPDSLIKDSKYIYECIIPAYTDFYVNEKREIVSSTLIIKRKITKLNSFRYNVCILWNKIKERIRDI